MRTIGKSLSAALGLFVLAVSVTAWGNTPSSAIAVMGEKPDCNGTFVHSGTRHDVMVLPATCLLNVDSGGLKVTGAAGETVRSVKAVIHPYLLKKKIYDLTKVPHSFDFAVALFPKGTAAAITPITRDFAQSLSGYFQESDGKPEFFPEFEKAAEESITDLEPDQSVTPGAPIFDGASRGLVAVGLGCSKDAKGNESCTAVSLHDALSRDVLSEAKRQFPDSLAALELPSKVHHLGHLGLFRRRQQCQQPCYRPAPVYCRPVCRAPAAAPQPAPAPQVVNNYTNSFNRTYVHSPEVSRVQETQAYARGYADARANNTNTNTASPVTTNTNVFKPSITLSPNIVASSPQASVGSSSSPYQATSYTSTGSSDREVETRLAYENAAQMRRTAEAEAAQTRARAHEEAQAARQAAEARQREQDAREVQFAQQSAAAAQEIKQAREDIQRSQAEIQRSREEIAQLKATLLAEIAALAKERKELEIERRKDRAKELKQTLDPKELEGVTGEEAGPEREKKPSEDYTNVYRRPALLDAPQKRNYGVENIAARDSGSLRVEGAVNGALPEPSLLASRTPFRPSSDLSGRSGVTELALNDLQNGKRATPRSSQLVVRSQSPFLGSPTNLIAGNVARDAYGQPTLAMYVPR